jgi:hypothetical protein
MCVGKPKVPKVPPAAERQQVKLPDNGSTTRVDDIARRRRAMAATAFTGALGLGSPTVTTVLGG